MAEHNIGFLVIVDGHQKPVGVLTDRDIVIRSVAWGHDPCATVAGVMTRHPVSVSEHATVTDAARLMGDRYCRRLPVIDDEGIIVGVLSLDDLLRVAGDELAEVSRSMRGTRRSHVVL
jgi:CBS domain-containing protein